MQKSHAALVFLQQLSSMYHRRSESQDSEESAVDEIMLLAALIEENISIWIHTA